MPVHQSYSPGPNESPENGIYHVDAWNALEGIPDGSVDLIFTDPVYENIEDYRRIAKVATRVLKPKGCLVVFYGIPYLKETVNALHEGGRPLTWQFMVYQPGRTTRGQYKMFNHYYAALWCGGQAKNHFTDAIMSHPSGLDYKNRDWGWRKNPDPMMKYIQGLSNPGDVVLDPFTGQGSIPEACIRTGRRYIAFELDEGRCMEARKVSRKTTVPLLVGNDDGWSTVQMFADEEVA